MNNFLLEFLPILLFFIAFKYYGIYAATWVGIIATLAQVILSRLIQKKWDKMQIVTLVVFVVFGGTTLYLHDPIFVKWKPSIVFWVFALVLLGSHFIGSKPLIQKLIEKSLNAKGQEKVETIPNHLGKRLNLAWSFFFIILGTLNLYVAYQFDDAVWVNFKLYGITSATILFSFLQAFYLMKHMRS